MSDSPNPVRRLVTGDDESGRSSIVEDGPAPAVITVPERPGYRVTNLWVTESTPAPIVQTDASIAHRGIGPPKGGTILRIIDYPPEPESREEFEAMARATFKSIYRDIDHDPGADEHPGMHTTETVDYAIVLEGEIYARMDVGEALMKAGDVLIQRGTSHGWSNRSGKSCRVAFVLIDGARG